MTYQVSKLTVITREDLEPGYQAVQAGHAAINYCFQNWEYAKNWHINSNNLIYLSTKTENDLFRYAEKLKSIGVDVCLFREPDIGNLVTSIAFISNEKTKKITSGLSLMLKPKKVKCNEEVSI